MWGSPRPISRSTHRGEPGDGDDLLDVDRRPVVDPLGREPQFGDLIRFLLAVVSGTSVAFVPMPLAQNMPDARKPLENGVVDMQRSSASASLWCPDVSDDADPALSSAAKLDAEVEAPKLDRAHWSLLYSRSSTLSWTSRIPILTLSPEPRAGPRGVRGYQCFGAHVPARLAPKELKQDNLGRSAHVRAR